MVLVIGFLLAGCSHDKREEALEYDPDKEPVKIGICLQEKGGPDEYSRQLLNGICIAHEIKGVIDNTKITLVMKQTCDTADLDAFSAVMLHEGLQGFIYSAGGPEKDIAAFDVKADQGSVAVMIAPGNMNSESDVQVFRIGSTMSNQARVAALFGVRSLRAGSVAIVLDQKVGGCILLASLFSSELIDAGGRIVNIAYVGDGPDELESSVAAMMCHNPDVIYIPYSEETSLRAIIKLKEMGSCSDVMISNVTSEQKFLRKGGEALDKTYLITDFHPDAVQSKRAKELMKRYAQKSRESKALETGGALSSEAYFLLCDLLMLRRDSDALEDVASLISDMETVSGMTGVDASGRITKSMHISQVHKGILRGPRLIYKESINPL